MKAECKTPEQISELYQQVSLHSEVRNGVRKDAICNPSACAKGMDGHTDAEKAFVQAVFFCVDAP